jgi:hypothetical protein
MQQLRAKYPTHVKIRIEPGIQALFLKQNISVTTLSEHIQNLIENRRKAKSICPTHICT